MEYAVHLSNSARIAALKIVVSKLLSHALQSSTTSSLPVTTSEEVKIDEEEVEVRMEPEDRVDEERSELFSRDFTDFEFS